MSDVSGRKLSVRTATLFAVVLVAANFPVSASLNDADAFTLGKLTAYGKQSADARDTQNTLQKVHDKLLDRVSEQFDLLANDGTQKQANAVFGKAIKDYAEIPMNAADPTYGVGPALWNKLKSKLKFTEDKIKHFVGGTSHTVSNARADTLVDRRSSLAVSAKERTLYESNTGILGNRPLPKLASARTGPTDSPLRSKVKEWARQQQQYPHCWGVVDASHDPYECMAKEDAKREVTAVNARRAQLNKSSKEKFNWSSKWTVEGDGLPVWDGSNSRYDDKDREAARVEFYASRCWGDHYVTRDNMFLYNLMKGRMERNECPGEDRQEQADKGKGAYEEALTAALGAEHVASEDEDSYLAALEDLDAKDAQQHHEVATLLDGNIDPADGDYLEALRAFEAKEKEPSTIASDQGIEKEPTGGKVDKMEVFAALSKTKCSSDDDYQKNCWIAFADSPRCGFFVGDPVIDRGVIDSHILGWHYEEKKSFKYDNNFTYDNIRIGWSGSCADGIAIGQGKISGYRTLPIGDQGCIDKSGSGTGNTIEEIAIAGKIRDDGRKDGRWTLSEVRSSEEMCSFVDIGLSKVKGSTETTVEINYLNGKEHGPYRFLFRSAGSGPNGTNTHTIEMKGGFRNGIRDGVWLTRSGLNSRGSSEMDCFRVQYSRGEELSRQEC